MTIRNGKAHVAPARFSKLPNTPERVQAELVCMLSETF